MRAHEPLAHLARALVQHDRPADLLPELHRLAEEAGGGVCSVILALNRRTHQLHPVSAHGVAGGDGRPWLDDPPGRSLTARLWRDGTAEGLWHLTESCPDLYGRLGHPAAILAPLGAADAPIGILVVGRDTALPDPDAEEALGALGSLATLALERARLKRDTDLQVGLRDLLGDFSRTVASSLQLAASLEAFCGRACRLLHADRVSVWLHDRRARMLELTASSDHAYAAAGARVRVDDPTVPVSAVMRRDRAEIVPSPAGAAVVVVPLRGRRRALGTLAIEGVDLAPGGEPEQIDRAEETGRQLASAVENVLLLDDVLRSRRELENTFNSLADPVAVCDRRLRVAHVNRMLAGRLAAKVGDLLDRPLGEVLGPEAATWIQRVAGAADAQAGATAPVTRELADARLGGTFAFTVSPLVGHDGERVGTVVVARDVTEQAQLEREREELRGRLAQSEKLAALGQFVAGIAHELNNPLQGVLGHLELLRAAGKTPVALRRDLRLVFREADRAAKIVNNLLVFAGSRRIKRRRLSLNLIAARVLSLRGAACAAQEIELVRDLAPRLPRLVGDALLLQQALLNIVVNAEQAVAEAPAPRRIVVRTRADEARRLVVLEVHDTGRGIAPEALPRLFEPFFTTKDVGQGTGLGLAIAYGVVQEHGGRILAGNRAEGGAAFAMELPWATDGVE